MTRKQLADKALSDLLAAQEELRKAVEQNAAGSVGQLAALDDARGHMDAARAKLVALEWTRRKVAA